VLSEITGWGSQHVFGLDLNLEYLHLAFENAPGVHLAGGDAHHLPYARDSFDVIFCHYLLLWVMEPDAVVKEMARVTRWEALCCSWPNRITAVASTIRKNLTHLENTRLLPCVAREPIRRLSPPDRVAVKGCLKMFKAAY